MLYLFIMLSCLGIADIIYILYKNRPTQNLVCPLNGNCKAVLESKWNKFLGVKNEYWGLLYYISLLIVMGLFLFPIGSVLDWKLVLILVTGFGLIYSFYLTAIQVIKIKDYCFYCLMSAGISLSLFVVSLFL